MVSALKGWAERQPFSVEAWDAKGHALFVNRSWRSLWQMPESVLVGSGYCILRDQQLRAKPVWQVLETGFHRLESLETPPSYYDPAEEDGRPGRARWTEGHIAPIWTGIDSQDEALGPLAYVILLHDVTHTMLSRQRLAQSVKDLQDAMRREAQGDAAALARWAKSASVGSQASAQSPTELVRTAPPPEQALSRAEQEVLRLLAQGFGPKEISGVLNKSQKTIYTQLATASQKLNLSGLPQLTVYACHWYTAW